MVHTQSLFGLNTVWCCLFLVFTQLAIYFWSTHSLLSIFGLHTDCYLFLVYKRVVHTQSLFRLQTVCCCLFSVYTQFAIYFCSTHSLLSILVYTQFAIYFGLHSLVVCCLCLVHTRSTISFGLQTVCYVCLVHQRSAISFIYFNSMLSLLVFNQSVISFWSTNSLLSLFGMQAVCCLFFEEQSDISFWSKDSLLSLFYPRTVCYLILQLSLSRRVRKEQRSERSGRCQ